MQNPGAHAPGFLFAMPGLAISRKSSKGAGYEGAEKIMSNLHQTIISILVAMWVSGALFTAAQAETKFKPVRTQFIASLAEAGANSGTGAEHWGLWTVDPGPRGVWLSHYSQLVAGGGVAPAGWTFNQSDWWLDENGLIMEHPAYGMPPGRYLVTGDRETTTVLTIHPKDAEGKQRWELAADKSIYDVTHLRCRSARYKPPAGSAACTPDNAPRNMFRVAPGAAMPAINGCDKQDYTVLFIIAIAS